MNGSEKATFSFTPLRKNGLLAAILLQQQDGPYGVVYALGLNKGVVRSGMGHKGHSHTSSVISKMA